jgi:hypothetical protein
MIRNSVVVPNPKYDKLAVCLDTTIGYDVETIDEYIIAYYSSQLAEKKWKGWVPNEKQAEEVFRRVARTAKVHINRHGVARFV